jgi:plastocyanin
MTALPLRVSVVVLGLIALAGCAPPPSSPTPTPGLVSPPSSPAAAAASPSPSANASVSPVVPSASVTTVQLIDTLRFEPASLTVTRGTTVTWRNTGQVVHTVTDDPAKAANPVDAQLPSGAQPWDSGNLNPGQTFSHTFDVPGTYKYFCQPHEAAGMLGTINVTP